MDTLWACDFFPKDVWTAFGKVTYYILFFHVGTRRVKISGMTVQPKAAWVEQQARNLTMELAERREKASHLLKDGDTKFTKKFDEVFRGEGIKVKRLPYASPNLNAFAERFVQSIKQECLDQFVVFGERHLEYLIREFEDYYNTVRPHQGLGNQTIGVVPLPPSDSSPPESSEVECDSRLGGLLRHYHRKSAKNGTQTSKSRILHVAQIKTAMEFCTTRLLTLANLLRVKWGAIVICVEKIGVFLEVSQ